MEIAPEVKIPLVSPIDGEEEGAGEDGDEKVPALDEVGVVERACPVVVNGDTPFGGPGLITKEFIDVAVLIPEATELVMIFPTGFPAWLNGTGFFAEVGADFTEVEFPFTGVDGFGTGGETWLVTGD